MKPLLFNLIRFKFGKDATIGRLETGDGRVCYICEDEDRGLSKTMTLEEIRSIKVMSETAIPVGSYEVVDTYSPKYKRNMLLLADVPGYKGIRIHSGNDESHTAGCLLPGTTTSDFNVWNSRKATAALEGMIRAAHNEGRKVFITITRDLNAWDNREV